MQLNIKEFLQGQGYPIREGNDYFTVPAYWRQGTDEGSVAVYPNKNLAIDFVVGEKFGLDVLVGRVLKLDTTEKIKEWLQTKQLSIPDYKNEEPKIKMPKIFDEEELKKEYIPNFDYWIKRGISTETCNLFKGGLGLNGGMKNRQCLFIYNSKKQVIGITGRDVTGHKHIKWRHQGTVGNWIFPAYLNHSIIKEEKKVILVESPFDSLKMWDAGIKNVLCLFGTSISWGIVNYLLRISPKKIYISTNNEESGVGNQASKKIQKKLRKYFDAHVISIRLPPKKDFGEMTKDEIQDFCKNSNFKD